MKIIVNKKNSDFWLEIFPLPNLPSILIANTENPSKIVYDPTVKKLYEKHPNFILLTLWSFLLVSNPAKELYKNMFKMASEKIKE